MERPFESRENCLSGPVFQRSLQGKLHYANLHADGMVEFTYRVPSVRQTFSVPLHLFFITLFRPADVANIKMANWDGIEMNIFMDDRSWCLIGMNEKRSGLWVSTAPGVLLQDMAELIRQYPSQVSTMLDLIQFTQESLSCDKLEAV